MDGSHELLDLTLFNTKLTTVPEDSDFAKTFLNIGNRLLKLVRSKPLMEITVNTRLFNVRLSVLIHILNFASYSNNFTKP
jgi:hypothetical protein